MFAQTSTQSIGVVDFQVQRSISKLMKNPLKANYMYANFFLLESTNLRIVASVNKIVSFCLFRFNINIYNMDAFMVCLLPFHESKIFIRAVQLLNLKSKTATKWDWLLPIQVNIWFFFYIEQNPAFILYSFKQKFIIWCVDITNSCMFIL